MDREAAASAAACCAACLLLIRGGGGRPSSTVLWHSSHLQCIPQFTPACTTSGVLQCHLMSVQLQGTASPCISLSGNDWLRKSKSRFGPCLEALAVLLFAVALLAVAATLVQAIGDCAMRGCVLLDFFLESLRVALPHLLSHADHQVPAQRVNAANVFEAPSISQKYQANRTHLCTLTCSACMHFRALPTDCRHY